jgi:hypothetical protein
LRGWPGAPYFVLTGAAHFPAQGVGGGNNSVKKRLTLVPQ